MSRIIRFGIIGYGHIGKRHADAITAHPVAQLTDVADVLPSHTCGASELDSSVRFHNSIESFLESGVLPDVVCVCTPNGFHARQSIALLNAGCDVILEKPISLNVVDAREIKEVSEKTCKKVFCVMQNRFAPPSVWLKDLVDSGQLGEVRQVHIQCFWNRDDRYYKEGGWRGTLALDGGPLYTQFSHFIDVMYWIFGGIKEPQSRFYNQAHKHNTEFEDSGQITFDFKNQGWGSFTFSTALDRQNFESSLTLVAEHGTVRIAGQYMQNLVHCDIDGFTPPDLPESAPPNDYGDYKGSASNHQHVISNVIDVLTKDASIATPISEGIEVVEIIEQMYSASDRPI